MNTEQGLVEAWRALADTLESPGFDRRSYIERLNTLADVNGYDRTASLTEMVRAIVEDYGLRVVQSQQTTSPDVRSACYLQGKIDGLYYLTWLAKKGLRPDEPEPNPATQGADKPCSEVAREGCWTVTPKWLNTPWIQTCCFASCGGLWPSPDAKACRSKASDYARTCTSTGPQHCESADRKYTIMPGCGHLCT
jgi:hypothetical protein